MSTIAKFHKDLLGSDPTPEQSKLYESTEIHHGYSNDSRDAMLFTGTLVLGLHTAFEPDPGIFHEVVFAIPKTLEGFTVEIMNRVIQVISKRRAGLDPKTRKKGGKLIAEAFKNLHVGHRAHTLAEEPPRWVAFGFVVNSPAPAWLRSGLLVL